MYVAWEEPFGPILPIIVYQDIKEAISLINQSQYGLQTCIFTTNYDHIETLALQIEAGTININKSSSRGPDILPFLVLKTLVLVFKVLLMLFYRWQQLKVLSLINNLNYFKICYTILAWYFNFL